jgi:site-specific DNA-methyltransferase (adenine-specific)
MIVEQMLNNAPNPLLHIADVSGSALFQGDCLDIMPLMPDKSVQLILADLPYGTTACKWDSIIDLDLLWKQYKRIITDNGAIVLTASQPFTTKLISSNYEMFKYEIIWLKSRKTGHIMAKNKPLKQHENILIFSAGTTVHANQSKTRMIYNPQGLIERKNKINYRPSRETKGSEVVGGWRPSNKNTLISEFENYPTSILQVNSEHNVNAFHQTQKPLELMKYLIKTYSNENDMVLDNTMGSGTTCLGAKELNRKFIGIEKEPKYYEIACQRCGF